MRGNTSNLGPGEGFLTDGKFLDDRENSTDIVAESVESNWVKPQSVSHPASFSTSASSNESLKESSNSRTATNDALKECSSSGVASDDEYLLIPRLDLSKLREKDRKRFGISASATPSPEPILRIRSDIRRGGTQSNPDLPGLLRQEMMGQVTSTNVAKLKSSMGRDNMIDITRFTPEMVANKGDRKKLEQLKEMNKDSSSSQKDT